MTVESVMNIHKKSHLQVYLEECKYRIKNTKVPKFIETKLKSDSDLDSDLDPDLDLDSKIESKSDAKLMAKLKKIDSDSKKN